WKNTMQVFHTAGVPPSSGRIIFPTIGWSKNRSAALKNSVRENSTGKVNTPVKGGRRMELTAAAARNPEGLEAGPGSASSPPDESGLGPRRMGRRPNR